MSVGAATASTVATTSQPGAAEDPSFALPDAAATAGVSGTSAATAGTSASGAGSSGLLANPAQREGVLALPPATRASIDVQRGDAGYDSPVLMYKIGPYGTISGVQLVQPGTNLSPADLAPGERVGFAVLPNGNAKQATAQALARTDGRLQMVAADGVSPANVNQPGAKLVFVGNDGTRTDLQGENGTDLLHSVATANSDGLAHVRPVTDANGTVTGFGFEDMAGGGDLDYNDLTVNFALQPNRAPVASPAYNRVYEDTKNTAVGSLARNAPDPDAALGDTVTFSLPGGGSTAAGQFGTLTLSPDGHYNYTLDPTKTQALAEGQVVRDQITVTATDAMGQTTQVPLTMLVNGTNDAPVAEDVQARVVGTPNDPTWGRIVVGNLPISDPDTGAVLTPSLPNGDLKQEGENGYGTFRVNEQGLWSYVVDQDNPAVKNLPPGQTLTDTIAYTVTDEHGATATKQITVTIDPPNQAPAAADATAALMSNATQPYVGTLPISDPEGDALTPRLQNGGYEQAGTYGTFRVNDQGAWSYTLDPSNPAVANLPPGQVIYDTVPYTVTDAAGNATPANLIVSVTGAQPNQAPVAQDATAALTNKATQPYVGTLPISDPEGDALTPRLQNGGYEQAGTYGTFRVNDQGAWSYTLDPSNPAVANLPPGQVIYDTVPYTVTDAAGNATPANLIVSVTGQPNFVFTADQVVAFADRRYGYAGGSGNTIDYVNNPNFRPYTEFFQPTSSLLNAVKGTTGIDNIAGTNGNDFVTAFPHDGMQNIIFNPTHSTTSNTISTGAGQDTAIGDKGRDYIDTGPGNDRVNGADGDDWISDPSGVNVLYGGNGNDVIIGGSDPDQISDGVGDDIVISGTGNDAVAADPNKANDSGNDIYILGAGDDVAGGEFVDQSGSTNQAEDGADIYIPGAGNDRISFGRNDITVYTGSPADYDIVPGDATNAPGVTVPAGSALVLLRDKRGIEGIDALMYGVDGQPRYIAFDTGIYLLSDLLANPNAAPLPANNPTVIFYQNQLTNMNNRLAAGPNG